MTKRYKPLSKRVINKMSTDELIARIYNLGADVRKSGEALPDYKMRDYANISDEIKERCGD